MEGLGFNPQPGHGDCGNFHPLSRGGASQRNQKQGQTIWTTRPKVLLYFFYRQLRDKFLSEERWQLAMEVSTKCGIDPSGVWLAWGKSCLRMGDYISAREKLAKCLKVSTIFNV